MEKKSVTPSADENATVTADAGGSRGAAAVTEDKWTKAEADAFIDELVARNQEALRGLAKL